MKSKLFGIKNILNFRLWCAIVRELLGQVGFQFFIALSFLMLMILWPFADFILSVDDKTAVMEHGEGSENVTLEEDLDFPFEMDETSPPVQPPINEQPKGADFIRETARVSTYLEFYFHHDNGLFAWVLTVILMTFITVYITYFRFRNRKIRAGFVDFIFIRWVELIPQFFIFMVAMNLIGLDDKYVPFFWCLTICWTMAPHFYRQLHPHALSFLQRRVYDAEIIIGENRWRIFGRYLIGHYCLPIVLVLVCFVLGSLILLESCMAYLVDYRNIFEFRSLGAALAGIFAHLERTGDAGLNVYENFTLEGKIILYAIFSGVIFFHVAGKLIESTIVVLQRRRYSVKGNSDRINKIY